MQSKLHWDLWYNTSTIGYTEVESCLIYLDFDDGDDVNLNTLTNCIVLQGKGNLMVY